MEKFLEVLSDLGDPVHHVLLLPVINWKQAEALCGVTVVAPRCICDQCNGKRGGMMKIRKCEICALQERKLGVVLELGD